MIPSSNENLPSGDVPPTLPPQSSPSSGSSRHLLATVLSVCLIVFLVDAVFSLADSSLILFCGLNPLSGLCGLTSFFALLAMVALYGLIGLTPMVPKRLFLPLPLYWLVATLAVFPVLIYDFGRLQLFGWGISVCEVIIGLWVLYLAQGKFGLRWPLVSVDRLGARGFSWLNLSTFVLVNAFGLLPAITGYLVVCTALAVGHFTEGFMTLRPNGFTVQVRKYVRDDGKTIELFPMAHVADARFYHRVSQTFPTNSIILMEGVTDEQNLLTNKISYRRMAKTLGLTEQRQEFVPKQGEMVDADVDVDIFSRDTIDLLNLVMLIHTKGFNLKNLRIMMQYTPPANLDEELIDDLVGKRNQHLVKEIQSHLADSDYIMVPWGVAHMPGIAREIQKAGFRLEQTQEYVVIQFGGDNSRNAER